MSGDEAQQARDGRNGVYDIVIVGCGPVGALAANLAGVAGLQTLVVDREAVPHPLPRAVHLDHEMMRLFQDIGLIDTIAPTMRETQGHLHVGADHGVIRYMGTAGKPKPFGWANDYFFYQPELEDHLRGGLTRFATVDVRLGADFTGLAQDDDGVSLTLNRQGTVETLRARYVVACDGARSAVRRELGIALEDLDFEEPWLVVDAEVDGAVRFPDLHGVPPAADLQQLSVMMCDPVRPATIVPGRGSIRRWEFMLLPGEDDTRLMQPDKVAELLAPYISGVPHRIIRATTYRFHGLIAQTWRKGRVLLAGDAAHQTPPFFGQGMCHGMRDVANLMWKVDRVVRGRSDDALLDTYHAERDPHVRSVVNAAVAAGRYICELDPERAAARDAEIRARAGQASTAADLIPPYRAGVVAADTPGGGERFIQPRVGADLLDEVTGGGWRLFTRDASAARAAAFDLPLTIVAVDDIADHGALAAWLDTRGAHSVLVRPDHYVFGTAHDDVRALFAKVRDALCLTPARQGVH